MATDPGLQQLAASGALCDKCGGVHATSIDQAIILLRSTDLPVCTCSPCPVCDPLRMRLKPYTDEWRKSRAQPAAEP